MKKTANDSRDIVLALFDATTRLERQLDEALSIVKGISLREYLILWALENEPKTTATRVTLAAAVGLTPSGVTRALRPLEKLGYISTEKDARDARRSLATLTSHGVSLARTAGKVVDETIADLGSLRELPVNDRARILDFLRELGT